jgi:pimeloyl-ACP methyl ester carboxylesterase
MLDLQTREDPVRGLEIFSRYSVKPGAPAIVLVHGLSISSRYEIPLARRLAVAFTVYAPDLPGFGQSDDPPSVPSIVELTSWLADWLNVVGLDRVMLVGNSLGANVAVELALQEPDRVTHLVLSGLPLDPGGRQLWIQIARTIRDVPREPLSLMPLHAKDFLVAGPGRVLMTLRDAMRDPFAAKLPHLMMPALVIRGEHDPLSPPSWAEEVARRLPNGRLAVIPGAPHATNYACPDQFAALVEGCMTR